MSALAVVLTVLLVVLLAVRGGMWALDKLVEIENRGDRSRDAERIDEASRDEEGS